MKNLRYAPYKKMTPWRKVSLASWKPRGDSSCYCMEDIIVDDLQRYCKQHDISIYSFFIKALSCTLKKHPKINSTVRWGKIYRRESISIFFHTIVDAETDDLSGIVIKEANDRNIKDVNEEFKLKIDKAKQGINEYTDSKKIIGALPSFLSKVALKMYSFFVYTLNWNWSIFRSKSDAYGSLMLTSVGSLGISQALCPIAPYTKVPMVISVGSIEAKPVVVNNAIEIHQVLPFGFTFDHRIMDGVHFAEFLKCFKEYVLNPKTIRDE